jgi:hypothetical protein
MHGTVRRRPVRRQAGELDACRAGLPGAEW